jgi:hypothetical protein
VDTPNSQKRSSRSSAKSKPDGTSETSRPSRHTFDDSDEEQYVDRSFDHVARVRAAKEATQREMESFGDVSEYDVTIIQGQLKEESSPDSQPSLDFERGATPDRQKEI